MILNNFIQFFEKYFFPVQFVLIEKKSEFFLSVLVIFHWKKLSCLEMRFAPSWAAWAMKLYFEKYFFRYSSYWLSILWGKIPGKNKIAKLDQIHREPWLSVTAQDSASFDISYVYIRCQPPSLLRWSHIFCSPLTFALMWLL